MRAEYLAHGCLLTLGGNAHELQIIRSNKSNTQTLLAHELSRVAHIPASAASDVRKISRVMRKVMVPELGDDLSASQSFLCRGMLDDASQRNCLFSNQSITPTLQRTSNWWRCSFAYKGVESTHA